MENNFNPDTLPESPAQNSPQGEFVPTQAALPVKPIAKPVYTLPEAIISAVSLVLAFVFTHFVCGYANGIWGGIFWALVGVLGAVFVRLKKLPVNKLQIVIFVVAEVFCAVPFVSSNGFVNFLAALYSFLLLFYLGITLSGAEVLGNRFAGDMLKAVFVRPFTSFADAPRAFSSLFKKAKTGKNILYVIFGLLIAAPLSIIVILLLMNADEAFSNAMQGILDALPDISFITVIEIAFAVPVGFIIFGAVFSTGKKLEGTPSDPNAIRIMPSLTAYVAVTPVCVFYVIYILSQFTYFTAAFGGNLPEQYSYAEFARRGFFELCVVAFINLIIIIVMQTFVKRRDDGSCSKTLKAYTIIIAVFTLLLIASAFSKMIMYISNKGLTLLRVYTSWFELLMAIVMIVIIVRQFKAFRIWRVLFAAFSIMLGALCFGDVEGNIANYNITAYETHQLPSLDIDSMRFDFCGVSAARYAARLVDSPDEETASNARIFIRDLENSIDSRLDGYEYFSIERELARAAINQTKQG